MATKKPTTLEQLKLLAQRTQAELLERDERIDSLVNAGGEPNAIDKILVNGVEQAISDDKSVNVTVPTKVSEISNDANYQTDTEVAASIQAAIAATGHATFVKVDAVPSADAAEANVLYLVMNSETGHYDIYAKVGTEVLLIDDTTVDLTAYSTTEQMNSAIATAIAGLNIGQYATTDVVNGVITRVETLESKVKDLEDVGATKVEASATNGNIKINGTETVVYAEPSDVLHGEWATDAEVNAMLTEVFGE